MSAINPNDSAYNSIISYVKNKKEAKSSSSIQFANYFAANNVEKTFHMQQDAALSNALLEARLEYNAKKQTQLTHRFNSSFVNNTNKVDSGIINALNAIESTKGSAYGYSVDSAGFMGADFNIAANIPLDFKVHKSTLEAIEHHANHNAYRVDSLDMFGVEYFEYIDMAHIIGQNYKLFADFAQKASFLDKDSFTQEDLAALPKGYGEVGHKYDPMIYSSDISLSKVSNIFKSDADLKEMKELDLEFMMMDISSPFAVRELDFDTNMQKGNEYSNFDPDFYMYDNEDGTKSLESLFVSFMKSKGVALGGGNSRINPEMECYVKA